MRVRMWQCMGLALVSGWLLACQAAELSSLGRGDGSGLGQEDGAAGAGDSAVDVAGEIGGLEPGPSDAADTGDAPADAPPPARTWPPTRRRR